MERVGVIISDGVVVNVILWADHTPDQLRADGYTQFEEVTEFVQRPGIGWTWSNKDGYRPPSPYTSWVWNDGTWQAPVPMPDDQGRYEWNEQTQTWDLIPEPETPQS